MHLRSGLSLNSIRNKNYSTIASSRQASFLYLFTKRVQETKGKPSCCVSVLYVNDITISFKHE